MDLSHPVELSVNDGIPKELCNLSYIMVDTAIDHIIELGPGTLLAKMDKVLSACCQCTRLVVTSWQWNGTKAFT